MSHVTHQEGKTRIKRWVKYGLVSVALTLGFDYVRRGPTYDVVRSITKDREPIFAQNRSAFPYSFDPFMERVQEELREFPEKKHLEARIREFATEVNNRAARQMMKAANSDSIDDAIKRLSKDPESVCSIPEAIASALQEMKVFYFPENLLTDGLDPSLERRGGEYNLDCDLLCLTFEHVACNLGLPMHIAPALGHAYIVWDGFGWHFEIETTDLNGSDFLGRPGTHLMGIAGDNSYLERSRLYQKADEKTLRAMTLATVLCEKLNRLTKTGTPAVADLRRLLGQYMKTCREFASPQTIHNGYLAAIATERTAAKKQDNSLVLTSMDCAKWLCAHELMNIRDPSWRALPYLIAGDAALIQNKLELARQRYHDGLSQYNSLGGTGTRDAVQSQLFSGLAEAGWQLGNLGLHPEKLLTSAISLRYTITQQDSAEYIAQDKKAALTRALRLGLRMFGANAPADWAAQLKMIESYGELNQGFSYRNDELKQDSQKGTK